MNKLIIGLKKLISGLNFTSQEMYETFQLFMAAPQAQQGAILALFAAKGESAEELTGALKYLLEQATPFDYPNEVIEIVGTGGDMLKTFNISTAASLVIASCGVKVAKHGGKSATSASGSFDVLEALNIHFYDNVKDIYHSLDQNNYAILWAPLFNPIFKALGPLRKELGIPTMLNLLGPLSNPLRPKKQVIGVYRKDLVNKIAQVLQNSGSTHALILHSHDGLDELSLSAPTYINELKNGTITEYEITPEEVGLQRAPLSAVTGGTPQENAKLIRDIFSSHQTGAPCDIVIFNAAAGLLVAKHASNLKEGVHIAKEAVRSGKALQLLNHVSKGK